MARITSHLTRRHFLVLGGSSAGALLLAACGADPTPTTAPAKPAAPAPTTAPAAKPAATTAPAAKPTAAPAAAAKPTAAAAAKPTAKPTAVAAAKPTAAPAAAAKPAAAGVKKVTFLIYGGKAENDAWNAKGDAFAKKYPGSQVEVIIPPGNYNEKLLAMIASNTAPDTFAAFSVRELAPKGILLALDDRLKSDTEFDTNDFLPGALDGGKYQGKQYAIPGGLGPQVTFFNVAKFKEAGLATPNEMASKGEWTYEKLLEVSQKLTKKDSGGKVTAFAYLPYTQQYTHTYGGGNQDFNDTYTECFQNKEAATNALQFFADLALKHHVAPLQTELQQYGSWQGFAQGNYAMFISGPWQQARLGQNMKDPWDIAPPPLQKDGMPIMNSGGNGTAVYAKTPDPDTSYKWATFSESKEGQRIWAGLGFDLPSRKSLVEEYTSGKFFSDPKYKPENVKLWYDMVPKSKASPHTYVPAEAGDKLGAAWGNVQKGTGTAKDEIGKVIQDVNRILKEK